MFSGDGGRADGWRVAGERTSSTSKLVSLAPHSAPAHFDDITASSHPSSSTRRPPCLPSRGQLARGCFLPAFARPRQGPSLPDIVHTQLPPTNPSPRPAPAKRPLHLLTQSRSRIDRRMQLRECAISRTTMLLSTTAPRMCSGKSNHKSVAKLVDSNFSPIPKRVMDGSEPGESVAAAVLSGAPIDLQARTVRYVHARVWAPQAQD
jgi:hypothetical protein